MLHNFTPWQVSLFEGWQADGSPSHIVLVKQSFEFDEKGNTSLMDPCVEIVMADEYKGDPTSEPLVAVNEQVAFKQGFEVYGNFTAYPPKGKTARVIEVELCLAENEKTLIKKRLRVTGERTWRRSLLGPVATDPAPILPTALCYSRAYGGKAIHVPSDYSLENPLGVGFKLKNKHAVGQLLPAIEYANEVLRKPSHQASTAGFSAIPSHWSPRVELIPEIDEQALMAGKYPFKTSLASNVYNTAPVDQQTKHAFTKGWAFSLTGLYPLQEYGQQQTVELPVLKPIVQVVNTLTRQDIDMRCDTLVIDSDAQCFSLLWRGHINSENVASNSNILVAEQGDENAV
ncbi:MULTISPECIES: DUF2169 domain-containing protein [unclassified Pseudoalteromonas]|uniref:DUF2169 family type VI secretion system accessory protein n=1 Tax=unclassified Pseudoalteromonas TaxID=194690 RepID=UPI0018F4BCB7|nr:MULTISPECIES: DUF2169 domain-containing protein [unclassified Pseudoalteromonas]MCC9660222.1 DUF2169 domain-containing protein [Pseudoalteromonas sp. MB41]